MNGTNLDAIAQGIIAAITVLGIVWAGLKGKSKSDGKAPPERPTAPSEIKEALSELRRLVENLREDHNDDARQIASTLDRIENRLRLNDEVRHWNERTMPPQDLPR